MNERITQNFSMSSGEDQEDTRNDPFKAFISTLENERPHISWENLVEEGPHTPWQVEMIEEREDIPWEELSSGECAEWQEVLTKEEPMETDWSQMLGPKEVPGS